MDIERRFETFGMTHEQWCEPQSGEESGKRGLKRYDQVSNEATVLQAVVTIACPAASDGCSCVYTEII